jgi:hypothetical protein
MVSLFSAKIILTAFVILFRGDEYIFFIAGFSQGEPC